MKKFFAAAVLAAAAAGARPAAAQVLDPYYTYFGQNKIAYDTFKWKNYRSTHFVIFYHDREEMSLQKVASFAESAYDEISRLLNFQIPKPINLIYYATHSEFEQTNTLNGFIPEGIGAFALPTRNRMVLPIDMPDEELQKLVAHELTHVFQFEIFFGGSFIRAYTSGAPQWLTEGMASYFAADEDSRDKMVLRDAVLSDQVPEIAERGIYGFFAYRFGHAVFDYIESEWGKDGVRDFVFEYRGQLGPNIDRVLKRTFGVTAEEFDIRFRRYLRQRYIKMLTERGEPIDFGDSVRLADEGSAEVSVRPFPSGDFGAAISTLGNDANVVVWSPRDRKLFRNLTKGFKTEYEYIVAQWLTTGPIGGVDLAVSPDGNTIAFFVRKERGRELLLLNALDGKIEQMIPMPGLDQQLNPAFSPDGRTVAFMAFKGGDADIYSYNLDTKAITNLTQDRSFDFAPTFSPDGQWIYYSGVQGTDGEDLPLQARRARLARADHLRRLQRRGRVALARRQAPLLRLGPRRRRLQHLLGQPRDRRDEPLHERRRRLLLAGRHPGPRRRASGSCSRPTTSAASSSTSPTSRSRTASSRSSTRRPRPPARRRSRPSSPRSRCRSIRRRSTKPSHKLFLEDAQILAGLASDGQFLSNTILTFGDDLGDRRLTAVLQTISGYTNAAVQYADLSQRLQKGIEAFYYRLYYYILRPDG